MKKYISRLLALVLVAAVTLVGCSGSPSGMLTGNYSKDTLVVVDSLRTAILLPEDAPQKAEAQGQAKEIINEFIARYRRDSAVTTLSSFTTMRTALNALAGHYSSYPNRPIPDKLKERLQQEFKQVEIAVSRGA
ncbi:photosystem II protein Psb27 [Planktothrix agardhii]|jgi:photosystem II Psb27 protein|uniref:Photosystem II lipoprotein Psb27 n=1 Tax=Planktothrix agardhii TaxID=1160 RepID=A0AAD1Q5E0_PLAAG|nr:photosystem II protein Psb27 [Planktothrix agardhii]MCF3606904.1 photosystem II protein Psb27 [Planktothrix agardhii 1033]BBD56984.1 photosystem II 11 kD protein [Planktothrix agardhii NIES-204]MCB8752912.1 photosystem II protein Psb27 [Planktothrix agardhii 1810]MCB8759924.1 photosystem II protein Psb27 [Planktothrix agardhii 1813]MCB8764320.1 photosystem II protein Psb27 [Planktothrix agardhii 1809]